MLLKEKSNPKYEKPKEKKESIKRNKSKQQPKRKINERKTSLKKKWEYLIHQRDTKSLLKDIWKTKNFQKEYLDKINKLHKKYSKQ